MVETNVEKRQEYSLQSPRTLSALTHLCTPTFSWREWSATSAASAKLADHLHQKDIPPFHHVLFKGRQMPRQMAFTVPWLGPGSRSSPRKMSSAAEAGVWHWVSCHGERHSGQGLFCILFHCYLKQSCAEICLMCHSFASVMQSQNGLK